MTHPRLLAVAVMLLGLTSNANAQGPNFTGTVGIGSNPSEQSAITLYFPYNAAISPLTFPTASSGAAPLTYSLPILNDLRFDPATRVLTGVPSLAGGGYFTPAGFPYNYTVTDAVGRTDTISVHIIVCESGGAADGASVCTPPSFTPYSIPTLVRATYRTNVPFSVTLPEATGGTGANPIRNYAMFGLGVGGALPTGLTFNRTTRVLTGSSATFSTVILTYRVGEAAGFDPEDRAAYFNYSLRFQENALPSFFFGFVGAQSYFTGQRINLTLPEAAGGGGFLSYTLTELGGAALAQALPGITLNPTTRVLSGILAGSGAAARVFVYTVTDSFGGTDVLDFMITVTANKVPDFADSLSIDDQIYLTGETVGVVLPVVTGGTGNTKILYALSPALPPGLSFDAERRPPGIFGTPTAVFPTTAYTYTATDTDTNIEQSDSDSLAFDITVKADTAPTFRTEIPSPLIYIQNTMITPLTLPEATGGNGIITYELIPDAAGSQLDDILPAGLTYNAADRTLTGTPTETPPGGTRIILKWVATDADDNRQAGDSAILSFAVVIQEDLTPAFAEGMAPSDQFYFPGETVALTLPEATIPGNGATTYTLINVDTTTVVADGGSVFGLTYNAAARTLTGTVLLGTADFFWIAQDSDGNLDDDTTLPFRIMVAADSALAFATNAAIEAQTFTQHSAIEPLTLPAVATAGNGPTIYTLTPAIAGLTLNPSSRVLTGTPVTAAVATAYTYTASDSDSNNAVDDIDTLTVIITVNAGAPDTAPAFAADAAIPVQLYVVNTMITPLTLPEATGGNGDLTYTLARVNSISGLTPGLTFDGAARPPTITGTPTEQSGDPTGLAFAYTVADGDGNTDPGDSDTLFFSLGVFTGAPAVTFPSTTGIGFEPNTGTGVTLFYPLGAAITPTTIPAAVGGTTPYTYSTRSGTPPPGLTFDAAVRVLSGTPTAAGQSQFNYRVDDSSMPSAFRNLRVRTTICESGGAADGATACTVPTFVTLVLPTPDDQVFENTVTITAVTLPEATTGGFGANPVRIYTATPLPAGLTFDPASRADYRHGRQRPAPPP